ncbi:hypothetical protein FPV67DRAFT_231035 [Lyophyllum atratum]|nr:hypothetical protein FPV67DRAFT_231035 [Lyophyllum atratum]
MSNPLELPQVGPTIALIPLPPGFTLEQFFAFQSSLVTISITAAVAFGIIVWDYVYLLPDEYKFYLTAKKKEWSTLAPYSFMTLRCAGVVSTLAAMCISSFQSSHCQAGLSISQGAAIIAVATSGMAFGYRVMDLWGPGNKVVPGLVSGVYLLTVVSWIAVVSQYRAMDGPPTPFGSNCQLLPFVAWSSLGYAASCLFNAVILVLMVLKFTEQRDQQSKIVYMAYRDSLSHVAISTAASVTFLIIQLLGPDYQLAKQVVLPFSTMVTATMGARVFLTLRLSRSGSSTTSRTVSEPHISQHGTMKVSAQFKPYNGTDKVAYVQGTASPAIAPKTQPLEPDHTLSPYTPSTPLSYSSASPSPRPSPRALPVPPTSKLPSAISTNLPQNPYTTFPPPPPSPPQVPQSIVREGSMESTTPLLTAKFALPSLIGKKAKKDEDLRKSTWV